MSNVNATSEQMKKKPNLHLLHFSFNQQKKFYYLHVCRKSSTQNEKKKGKLKYDDDTHCNMQLAYYIHVINKFSQSWMNFEAIL